MLRWAAIFFIIAIVAAVFGAGDVQYLATKAAIALFVIALVFVVIGFLGGRGAGGAPPAI